MASLGNTSIIPITIPTRISVFARDLNGTVLEGNLTDTLNWMGKTREGSFQGPNDVGEETFYPQCYYYDIVNMITVNTILFVFGTIGNILILFVMWTDAKKHITSFLLANLAVSDTFVLTTYWFFQSPKAIAENFNVMTFFVKYFGFFLQKYQAVIITFMSVSTWTIVLAAIQRYLAIFLPTIANNETMKKRIRISVLVIWIGSIIYNVPRYFFLDVIYIKSKDVYVAKPNGFGQSFGFKYIYNTVMHFLTLSVIPMCVMLFATVKLVKHMRKIQAKKATMTSKSEQERGINKSLVVIVIVFFIFTITLPINSLLRNVIFEMKDFECPKPLYFFGRLNPTLLSVNSSGNFPIYILCSKYFRAKFLRKLGMRNTAIGPVSNFRPSNRTTRITVATLPSNVPSIYENR